MTAGLREKFLPRLQLVDPSLALSHKPFDRFAKTNLASAPSAMSASD